MRTLTVKMSVGEIAAERPAAIRVFERLRIDYCCGGSAPLEKACRDNGSDAEVVLNEIAQSSIPDGRDWTAASAGDLIDHIVGVHHEYLKAELPRLTAALEKVRAKHGPGHPEIAALGQVFGALRLELENHLMKEEMVLFPMVKRMEQGGAPPSHCGSVQNPVRVMEMEHDSAGEALARLREITGGYSLPEDACNTWRGLYYGLEEMERDLHRHIHLENNILFKKAVELEAMVALRPGA